MEKNRMDILEGLAISLITDHLKSRANFKNLPLDVKAYLSQYKNNQPDPIPPPVQARAGPCHECGKHRNNKTTVRCSQCTRFVCKNHSTAKVECRSCTAGSSDEDL